LGSGFRKAQTDVGSTNYQLDCLFNQCALRVILEAASISVSAVRNFSQIQSTSSAGSHIRLSALFVLAIFEV
jgi:hypothetical protein